MGDAMPKKCHTISKDNLSIKYLRTSELVPWKNNPRTHSKKQLQQIADSIRQFGFTNPVLLDDANGIIAGHGRVEACKILGIETVPTICFMERPAKKKKPETGALLCCVLAGSALPAAAEWAKPTECAAAES